MKRLLFLASTIKHSSFFVLRSSIIRWIHNTFKFSNNLCIILVLSLSTLSVAIDDQEDRKTYIVYMGSLPTTLDAITPSQHVGLLERVMGSNHASDFLIRSYKRSFNGFAAKLTDQERERLASMEEVVSVFPSTKYQLHTTRSWDFVGLNEKAKRHPTVESNVIIGVIDSGIWPESESFSDEGFGPPPKKWKGSCEGGQNFTCNNKLIGARSYNSSSARDELGHGSHTASTAAGNAVKGASFYGLANGTARGGAPSARIAAYRVCNADGCSSDGILAAFDDAIADGVDIITVSLGRGLPSLLDMDVIAIGAFHAMKNGILTANSAGNGGRVRGIVSSVAPWMISVAASSTDRRIIDKVVLGNRKELVGVTVNSFASHTSNHPLVYGKDAGQCDDLSSQNCEWECLDEKKVKGKIVVCDKYNGSREALRVGAQGAIVSIKLGDAAYIVPLPATSLGGDDLNSVKSYLNSTKNAESRILRSEEVKDSAAPVVVSFSSRGPNYILADIIKPDISAPGVDILAAYSPIAPVSEFENDKRSVNYSIVSGTSMSCPHVAGAAAYVKEFHPDWSPAAIKSSLMTTTRVMNSTGEESAGEFAYGYGHIDPVKALNPGLVYETSKDDYVKLLCSVLEDEDKVKRISGEKSPCPKGSRKVLPKDLNYPSLGFKVESGDSFTVKFERRMKNVGVAESSYKATIVSNSANVDIKVVPQVLSFTSLKEEKNFTVNVAGSFQGGSYVSAELVWSDGTHSVRSPIVIYTYLRG